MTTKETREDGKHEIVKKTNGQGKKPSYSRGKRRPSGHSKSGKGNQSNTPNTSNASNVSAVLYYQNPELPQASINARVPFNDFSNLINITTTDSVSAKTPVHFYSLEVALTLGSSALARSVAINNWYTLLRGAKTQFSDFRPIDLANYQQACHFVKLVSVFVEETIRMIDAKSFSDSSVNYKLVQSLSRNAYASKTAFDVDINMNLMKLKDAYSRFRSWILSKCFVVDSYNVRIDQIMHAGFVDDNVSYEVAPVVIFRPYIAAFIEANHVYDPVTGKPQSFSAGEIAYFPCQYASDLKDKWFTRGENETWLSYLIKMMQKIQVLWGNTYDVIASYLAGITGVGSNMVCPPEHLSAPWTAEFNPLLRSQVRNASLFIEHVAAQQGSTYSSLAWENSNIGTLANIRNILKFDYDKIITVDYKVVVKYPGTNISKAFIPTNTAPSGRLAVPVNTTIQPAIHPVSIDSALKNPIDVPLISELISPLTVSVYSTSVTIEYDHGVVFPYMLSVNEFQRGGDEEPINKYAIMNRAMNINNTQYLTFMAFHTSWNRMVPCSTTALVDATAGVVDAFETVDYEQLAKMSADSISEGHKTEVQSFWTQWTARPNGATASADKRVRK